jgi:hypothetical protein
MSYNANLAYFLSRLQGVSTNYFRLEPQNTTTATANKIIRFSLPSNALLNMRSLAFHFNASANEVASQGGRLPPKIESLIDRVELSAGGVQVAQGFNNMNVLKHAKDALMGREGDPALGHPEMVRTTSYVDGFGDAGTSGLTSTENENYPNASGQTQFCIKNWEGLLGSIQPSIVDTALMPDMVLTIYLAGDEVLSSSAGVALKDTGASDFTDAGAGGAKYSISNFHLVVETLGLADAVYDEMMERRISQAGFVELPFKQYFSFSDTHTGSSRFTISTQSLDRVWCVWRATGYNTQGAPVLVNGYKKAGAFVDDVAGQTAADIDIGRPQYDIGGVLDTNKEKYLTKFFNFAETRASASVAPTHQLQLNGAYIPQFRASAEEMYDISCNSVEGYKMAKMTLDQYKNNFFCYCVRLNLPDSEAGRELSGLDTRGISLNGYVNSTGVASSQNLLIFAECSSTLRVGAGRAIEVVQ